jgi:hypothetical protein
MGAGRVVAISKSDGSVNCARCGIGIEEKDLLGKMVWVSEVSLEPGGSHAHMPFAAMQPVHALVLQIELRRIELGWNIPKLSEEAEMCRSTVREILSGLRGPTMYKLEQLASAVGLKLTLVG